MPRENIVTAAAARLARIPFALAARRPFEEPHKVLILQPCCMSQVMLATPLLAVLQQTYPSARFDWAVSDWARPVIAGNVRITELVGTGPGSVRDLSWRELRALIVRLREEAYDTCFIPSRSSLLAYVAWRAGIPQRVGLDLQGRGFAHTIAVTPPEATHAAEMYLALARAVGVPEERLASAEMEFYPPDRDRTNVTRRLVEEVDWLGDVPLVIFHPGGGQNPVQSEPMKRWPVERFARLCNHLTSKYAARVVIVGPESERPLAASIDGMTAARVTNLAGRLTLGELGALCEVADLYVGNDAGPTHIAAATGCPTLVIYGPSSPVLSRPYSSKGTVVALQVDLSGVAQERPFSWELGITVDAAIEAVDELLARRGDGRDVWRFLTKSE